MKRRTLKLFALLLALVMVMALLPTAAFAEGQSTDHNDTETPLPNGYIRSPEHGTRAVSDAYARGDMETYYRLKGVEQTRDTLPSSYDSRDYNYITSVKNQNPYGSCWAHAAMACIESYMIKHGVEVGSTGSAATTSLNLSETQHCYFNYSTAYDAEGMLTGDKCTLLGSDSCLDSGGNGEMSAYTLQRWCGAADESAATDLQYSKASTVASSGLNSQYSYNYNISHVQNSEWIPATDIEGVKRAIMSYGAGNISYYAGDSTYTYNCTIDTSSQSSSSHKWANHAITLVGWDDSISASRFSPDMPSGDGAWLCKNSWGTSYFNQGYMYISYEDTSVLEGYIFFYDAEPIDNYDHNYQYDGSCNVVTYGVGNRVGFANNTKVANVFTANGSEMLKAVALCNWDEALDYTVEIYKNPTAGNPSSGTLMSTQSGTLTYSGYYTIVLDTPVLLSTGDTFSVVFTQSCPEADDEGKYVHTPYDANFKDTSLVSWASWTHTNHGNTSYYQEPNGAWTDCPDNGDYRIKAYTVDYENPYTVTAVSNNSSYGTVSVTGTVITATPADGYYVESAEVISGTATVTVNGNTVNVSPESDCEIRVNFAPKPSYTVNFVAVGNAEGSETALLNDTITLPGSVSVNVDGWEFSGWVDAELAETTDEPAFYAPGASYTVTVNATLYALYTRLEEGFGAPVYELVTAAPSDWSGNYVITNGETSSMYVMKGVTLDGDSQSIESNSNASAFANSGITLADAVLSDVATDYVFTLAAQDSYYSIQSVSTGVYLGMNSSYLYGFTYYDSSFCDWTPDINSSHAVRMENAAGGSFPYLSFTSNGYFWAYSASNADVLRLWKETNGDAVYYTTTPHEPYTITAVSNNDAWGTVSVSGNTITATPATGCYFSGYEVTSGTATVIVNDNTIRVKPESDCTITVIFAQKPSYTVSFVAVGYNEGSETAYEGDEITLPSSVSTIADGWEFSGWIDAELAETTNKPVFYAPGASYTVTENATLYALYTRTEAEGGEPVYELVTEAPSDWSGRYVITNGETSSMYVLKGVNGSSNGTDAENSNNCTAFANTGIILGDNVLSDVADDYVMTLEAQGSYYTVQSASIGSYYGMNSSSYLYAYSGYNATYCNWTPAINSSHGVQLKNAANGSYPYLSFSTSNSYFWSGSSTNANVLRLWKETGGNTVYYTTSPVAPHQHTYSEWASNNDGTHSCTCSGCGDVVTEDCTYNDVVTYPTTTEQGYTTHTCTVCGYSYVDSYVDPVLYTVTAVSNNDAWGTVSVGGYTIIATPATGYYLSDCEVTTGTATTTVSGNTITVTPESDCTVTVNFAPIPTYTVTYISTGAPAGSATGYIGDVINLPTSVSNEPDDWTFIGWMETKLDETTEEPAYYEPGEDYTVTGDVTLYALFTRVEEGTGDVAYQLTEELAVGGRYVITNYTDVGEYAVGNTIVNTSNNHFVNALSVTTDSDTLTVPSGVDADTILYEVESGDTSAGWVFSNVANNKYLGLTADEYLTMSDTPIAWRYDYDDVQGYYYLDNQIDSEGYYYLSLDTTNYRFTTNKSAKDIRMYQEINAAVNYYTTDPVAAVGLEVTIASGDATFEYDGTLKTNHQYTVTVEGEAVEADATGLTFTLPTGDVLTITPADTAAVTHVREGAVENAFTCSFNGNEDLYHVTATYGTLTVTPHAVTLTVVGNHATVVYNGRSQNVKGWTLECDDELFWSAREASSIIEHLDPPIGEKAWMAKGTEPGTYYMNIDVSEAYLQQVDTSETAAHFVDDFDPTWEVVDGYLVIVPDEPAFMTQSLLLEGDIGVRFYVRLPEALRNSSTNVSFTISGKNGGDYASTVNFSEDLPTNGSGYYGFTFYVNTIQMADTITATLNYGDGETLEKTYSVKEYFEAFDMAYDTYPELYTDDVVNLIKATADLGHYMQPYLETRGNWSFENGDHVEMDQCYTTYTQDDLDEAKTVIADHALTVTPSGDVSKFKKMTYTVNFESQMSIHVIVQMKATFSGELTATASYTDDEGTYEVTCNVIEQTGTKYMIEIPNVQAHQLSHMYEIVISSDEGALTLTGSALSYVNMMLAGEEVYNGSVVQDAAIAFYRYSKFADIVKGNPSDISKANGSSNN